MLIANWHEPVEIPAQKETAAAAAAIAGTRDPFQQMEARSSQINHSRQPGAGEIIPYPERRGSEMEKQFTPKEPAETEQSACRRSLRQQSSPLWRRSPETEQSAMSKEPAATEQSTMAKELAATKRQPTPEAPSVSASERRFLPSAAPKSPSSPSREPVCSADKWEQLCTMYPEIHPFRDSREYLSIAPKVCGSVQGIQKLVHNSFLLHGYYNCRHLILGRIRQKDAWQYYIGVPGNFYDREKMVAEMFGFEAFEGEKNPHRRAITGII
ncbi:MAG: hypothetical protein ACLURV_10550 [Gallintestinimicrobium sp.]